VAVEPETSELWNFAGGLDLRTSKCACIRCKRLTGPEVKRPSRCSPFAKRRNTDDHERAMSIQAVVAKAQNVIHNYFINSLVI